MKASHPRSTGPTTVLLASACTLAGDLNNKSALQSLGEGFFIFPFEIALPLALPHTYRSILGDRDDRFNQIGANCNIYRVIVDVQSNVLLPLTFNVPFRVLAHPMHAVLDPSITIAPSTKHAQVTVSLQGPSAAWRGETFPLTVSIQNNSTSTIDHIAVKLKMTHWMSGKTVKSNWKRFGGEYSLKNDWKFPIDPSPIAPGQHWTNTVAVAMPSEIGLSILSTISPLLQIGHFLTVKAISSGKYVHCNGTNKLSITVSDHYRHLEHLTPPTEAVGEVGKIIIAPPIPEMASKIVPSPALQHSSFIPPAVSYFGGTADSIASLPGAGPAVSILSLKDNSHLF